MLVPAKVNTEVRLRWFFYAVTGLVRRLWLFTVETLKMKPSVWDQRVKSGYLEWRRKEKQSEKSEAWWEKKVIRTMALLLRRLDVLPESRWAPCQSALLPASGKPWSFTHIENKYTEKITADSFVMACFSNVQVEQKCVPLHLTQ